MSAHHEVTAADVRMEAVLDELQAIRKLLERPAVEVGELLECEADPALQEIVAELREIRALMERIAG